MCSNVCQAFCVKASSRLKSLDFFKEMLQNLRNVIDWFVQEPHGDHAPAGEDYKRPHRLIQQVGEDSLNNNHVLLHVITSRALRKSTCFHSKTCKTMSTLLALLCGTGSSK